MHKYNHIQAQTWIRIQSIEFLNENMQIDNENEKTFKALNRTGSQGSLMVWCGAWMKHVWEIQKNCVVKSKSLNNVINNNTYILRTSVSVGKLYFQPLQLEFIAYWSQFHTLRIRLTRRWRHWHCLFGDCVVRRFGSLSKLRFNENSML